MGGGALGEVNIDGAVAIVTGGGAGIGRATALALASAGAAVVVADIDAAAAGETQRAIERAGGRASCIRTDVTRQEDIDAMVAAAVERYGGLQILHNNAGINAGWPRFPEASAERWQRTLAINLWAVIAGTQAAIPAMRAAGGGTIVNMASLAGLVRYETDPIYAATKHGVVGFTRALAFLKDEANVRVNCVAPAFVDTELPRRRLGDMPDDERGRWQAALDRTPMISPAEVAGAVLALVRDDTRAGEVLALIHGRPPQFVAAPAV